LNKLYEKSIKTLELPRILEMLASHAVCDEAKERALALLPSDDIDDVKQSMAETSAAVRLIGLKGSPPFSGVKDLGASVRRAERGGSLNMVELLQVAALLNAVRRVKAYSDDDSSIETVLDYRFSRLAPNKYLEDRITGAILSEEEVADSASPELYDLRRKIRLANSKVRETLQRIITSSAYSRFLQEALITQRSGRYVVPVKSEHKGDFPGLVHDVSSSGATFFVEPMQVVQLNNEIRELASKEEKEIERILAELSAEVADHADNIIDNYKILVELDFIFAKGKLAYAMRAAEPAIRETPGVRFRNARHPLLERATAVPITVSLGEDFDTLVVTGPNTGGKTVALKTIGLLTLMAMSGLHIPAEDGSYVSVFTGIYADIGDEQSIEQSLSTFSSHMTNIVAILGEAKEGTLILFDELGAGTDPIEGAALAVSIIEHARTAGAMITATTHYAELKEYALTTSGVENASCEFDVETLKPTYRLLIGIPGKSNAFAISKRLGLPEDIIEHARSRINSENRQFEDVVSTLEKERQAMEAERLQAEKLRREAQDTAARARKFKEDSEKERSRARERANAEARQIIESARAEVDKILEELTELRKRSSEESFASDLNRARSELRRKLNAADDKLKPSKPQVKARKPSRPIKQGDTVRLLNVGTNAAVLTPPDESGNLTVQAGIMKVTLNISEVELVETDQAGEAVKQYAASLRNRGVMPQSSARSSSGNAEGRVRTASTEVDLRGMATDEALIEMERFIDGAVLSKLNTLTIIHGKGTGALRAAVQQNLRNHPNVKSFRLGRYGEGEAGVTIVELAD